VIAFTSSVVGEGRQGRASALQDPAGGRRRCSDGGTQDPSSAIRALSKDATNTQSYATFVVELLQDASGEVRRTRVVHVQTNVEGRWAGWDGTRLLRFILTQATPPPSPPSSR
jgi:hypothetical protein